MKENSSSKNLGSKFQRRNIKNKLFTEQIVNSAFKIVVTDMEVMICNETLAPSDLEKQIVQLGKDYKSDFRSNYKSSPTYSYAL